MGNAMECNGAQWNVMECDGVWGFIECQVVVRSVRECGGVRWSEMECEGERRDGRDGV